MVPITAPLYWLRPNTIKMPYRLDLRDGQHPLLPFAGTRRNLLDIGLYVGLIGLCLRALIAPQIAVAECAPVIGVLILLGLFDFTIWLAARSEVWLCMVGGSNRAGGHRCTCT